MSAEQKQTYEPPTLRELGAAGTLTQGNRGPTGKTFGGSDGFIFHGGSISRMS
jgi:hypothetical protein